MSAASIAKEAPLTVEEAAELQAKLRDAGKNCKIFQQKVDALFESVANYRRRRDTAIEEVGIKRSQLAKTEEKIARLVRRIKALESDKVHKEELASHLERQLGVVNGEFRDLVSDLRESTRKALGGIKAARSRYTTATLAMERGYDCGVGSTFSLRRSNESGSKSTTSLLQFNKGRTFNR